MPPGFVDVTYYTYLVDDLKIFVGMLVGLVLPMRWVVVYLGCVGVDGVVGVVVAIGVDGAVGVVVAVGVDGVVAAVVVGSVDWPAFDNRFEPAETPHVGTCYNLLSVGRVVVIEHGPVAFVLHWPQASPDILD